MILQKTLQSASISKSKRNLSTAAAAAVILVLTAGCSDQRPVFTRTTGYVNLDALVKASPGWANVDQLTNDIATVASVRKTVPPPGFDGNLATLPSIAGLKTEGTMGVSSPEYAELWRRANRDLRLLADRRAISRNQQLERQSESWSLAASDEYDASAETIALTYAQRVEDIYSAQKAERISLELQIATLRKTLSDWAASAPPPTPRLNAAKADLAAKEAELQAVGDGLTGKLAAARHDRDRQLADAQNERDTYVSVRLNAERDRLEKIDSDHLAEERVRLAEQIKQLVAESSSAERASILKLQALKPYSEDMTGTPVAPEDASGANSAIATLVNQRNRRKAFLYDTVRASALKIAERKHWNIVFIKNGSTRTDLTGKIAAIMAARSTD